MNLVDIYMSQRQSKHPDVDIDLVFRAILQGLDLPVLLSQDRSSGDSIYSSLGIPERFLNMNNRSRR